MSLRKFALAAVSAALLAPAVPATAQELFIPLLVYRTGAYAPSGIPVANAMVDYFKLLNERDGGIGGVKIAWEECETQYDTKLGVECYERLKAKKPLIVNPYSTGITYQLIPKAAVDKIPLHSMGYGMTASADGRWFPWVFNFPTTYWSQASAFIRFAGAKEGGIDKLKGKKIAHVFHNSPYGKEANPTLEELAKKHGYELHLFAVDHPGQEQKATWLQIRRLKPDWIFMSGWGVMNSVAVKEAAAIGFKMDRFVGNWWSSSEADVLPAGKGAVGYIGATFHSAGTKYAIFNDLKKFVYDKGQGTGEWSRVGENLYNRGIMNAVYNTEAIWRAQRKYNVKVPTTEQVRWALENFDLTADRLKDLGLAGFASPIKTSCLDHEGGGAVLFQQWDGKQWKRVSDFVAPIREVVRPSLEAAAVVEGKKLGYTMRDCAKEG
jgi:branched-chain amino acid transport system substrate-binding protein